MSGVKMKVMSGSGIGELLKALAEVAEEEETSTSTSTSSVGDITNATVDEAKDFLSGQQEIRVGDIIKWRPGYRIASAPDLDEEVVVTQEINPPVHRTDQNVLVMGERYDIAIGVKVCGTGEQGEHRDHFAEIPMDSRRFVKVGSIYS